MAYPLERRRGAITGHSYVKHLFNYATNDPSNKGMDCHLHLDAAIVSWNYKGGWTWQKFLAEETGFQSVIANSPDIVFCQLGGNELDSSISAQQVAQQALNTAKEFINNGVTLVIIGEELERNSARNLNILEYLDKVKQYNKQLFDELIDPQYNRSSFNRFKQGNIWYWDHLKLR
jgi:hypothetical protein